jgi:hypothetical protein
VSFPVSHCTNIFSSNVFYTLKSAFDLVFLKMLWFSPSSFRDKLTDFKTSRNIKLGLQCDGFYEAFYYERIISLV